MTEYIANSLEVGRRPKMFLILAYSSSFSPSSAQGWEASGLFCAFVTVSKDISDPPSGARST